MNRVAVTHEKDGEIRVLVRVPTIQAAENFIALQEAIDPAGVHAGDYGIDAPEEMVNG